MAERWPSTIEEFQRDAEQARLKYAPLLARLSPAEIHGLAEALHALQALRAPDEEARKQALAAGWRPPGTTVGR